MYLIETQISKESNLLVYALCFPLYYILSSHYIKMAGHNPLN